MENKLSGMAKNNQKAKRPYLTKKNGKYELKVRVSSGNLTLDQIQALKDISGAYCAGKIHLTARQEVLLYDLEEAHIEDALNRLEAVGLKGGSAGMRVRNIMSCVGSRCKNCTWDPAVLARELDEKYGEMELPGAVKMAIAGCPFPCIRPQLNDIGIIGRILPQLVDAEKCQECGMCEKVCKIGAISLLENKKSVTDYNLCVMCGRCILHCPSSARVADKTGVTVTVGGGGSWPVTEGFVLVTMIGLEQVVPLVGKILDYYKKNSMPGEKRLKPFVKRIGIEKLREDLLKDVDVLIP